jgi:hypothetical protein
LAEVDELRLRHISGLFAEMGFAKAEANARSVLVYSLMRVGPTLLSSEKRHDEIDACLAPLMSLERGAKSTNS